MDYVLLEGDTLLMLKEMDNESADSIVTDPPYGLKFMNKKWDYEVPSVDVWKEAYRVLKAGGHMLVACGTRTQHRMVVNIEDAGFEIRDVITWHYGSGFPKSMDISKAIDKQAGAEREVVGIRKDGMKPKEGGAMNFNGRDVVNGVQMCKEIDITTPSTDEAKQWEGWGTALKPATEFWTLCRKPLAESTVAENVLKHGTGGINIDGCRVELSENDDPRLGGKGSWKTDKMAKTDYGEFEGKEVGSSVLGRFPANLILDEFAAELLDQQSGITKSGDLNGQKRGHKNTYGKPSLEPQFHKGDKGGASRFFYVAKASTKERNAGVESLNIEKEIGHNRFDKCANCGGTILQNPNRPSACKCEEPVRTNNKIKGNIHPTVKPIQLMRYLIKMITPKDGICLDLYNGSGTTGCGCALENINYIGIDREGDYIKISEARIEYWKKEYEKNNSN